MTAGDDVNIEARLVKRDEKGVIKKECGVKYAAAGDNRSKSRFQVSARQSVR